jgi:hypothetical protein
MTTSGCGLVQGSSAREVGARFADALEGSSETPLEAYLAPDADVYLQGGLHLSRQAFLDHHENMRGGYAFFHRMSPVYVTRGGAGWLLDTIHASDAETAASSTRSPRQATLWLEATIVSGQVTRLWVHFTLETLLSLRQVPATYAAQMAAEGLPLPVGWADGTPALVTAAEALDAEVDASQPHTDTFVAFFAAPITAAATALLVLRVLVTRRRPREVLTLAEVETRNSALLFALRERRQRAHEDETSQSPLPV